MGFYSLLALSGSDADVFFSLSSTNVALKGGGGRGRGGEGQSALDRKSVV